MISRGTTPTYTFTLPDDIDLTVAEKVVVTFTNLSYVKVIEKTDADIVLTAHTCSVYLSQEETLAFPSSNVLAQINIVILEGSKRKRIATEIVKVPSCRNLINEVI